MGEKINLPPELAIQLRSKNTEEKIGLLNQWRQERRITGKQLDECCKKIQERSQKKQTKDNDAFLQAKLKASSYNAQRKKKELKEALLMITRYLTEQSSLNEEQINSISSLFTIEDYHLHRDNYIALLMACFKLRQHKLKDKAAAFLREILEKNIIEWSVLIGIIDLNYISKKTYQILKDFQPQISAEGLGEFIFPRLRLSYQRGYIFDCDKQQDIPINDEKKKMLEELINLYRPPVQYPYASFEDEANAIGEGQ